MLAMLWINILQTQMWLLTCFEVKLFFFPNSLPPALRSYSEMLEIECIFVFSLSTKALNYLRMAV